LYVVMTNLPGPGAHALLEESGHAFGGKTGDEAAEHSRQMREVLEGASEFVELENEHGAGVGPSSGVTWVTENSFTSDKTYAKLGPFEPPITRARLDAVKQTLANVGAPTHDSSGAELNANGRLVDWLAGKRNPDWIGTEGAVIDSLRQHVVALRRLHEATEIYLRELGSPDDADYPEARELRAALTAAEKLDRGEG
jgi:hypothetical protein